MHNNIIPNINIKRVLLLNPVAKDSSCSILRVERCQQKIWPGMGLWPPIGLAYVAAVLEELELEIFLLDAEIENLSFGSQIKRIKNIQPDIILLQGITGTVYDDNDLIRRLKKESGNFVSVIIGTHATARPQDYLDEEFDFAILGEPEISFKMLIQATIAKKSDYDKIPGLAYKNDGKIYKPDKINRVEHLDDLPFPSRKYLKNQLYIMPTINRPFTLIKISRGCPFHCIYCTAGLYYGSKPRQRSAENIFREIKEVIEQYNINTFVFSSDTFNVDKKLIGKLLDKIIESQLNITWLTNSRTELLDEEIVKKMKKAGCYLLSLGIESGDNDILRKMKKGNTTEDAEKAVAILKKHKIKSMGYFILGLPGETETTIKRTIQFMLKLDTDYIHCYTATPYPGTEFYDIAMKEGWISEIHWDEFYNGSVNLIKNPGLSNINLKKYQQLAYRKFYFRFSRILKEIVQIRSLSEIKNYLLLLVKFFILWCKKQRPH